MVTPKTMRRSIVTTSAFAATALIVAGCSGGQAAPAEDGAVTLTVALWIRPSSTDLW